MLFMMLLLKLRRKSRTENDGEDQVTGALVSITASEAPARNGERRAEVRRRMPLQVTATCPQRERSIAGIAENVSPSGICIAMPERPAARRQHLTVAMFGRSARVWADVVDCELRRGEWRWHIRVRAASREWASLVSSASKAPMQRA